MHRHIYVAYSQLCWLIDTMERHNAAAAAAAASTSSWTNKGFLGRRF